MSHDTKYPRKIVLEHRERLAEDAKADLARAVREREARERAKAQATEEAARANAARAKVREDEDARLARGELSAWDLAQRGAWELRAEAEAEALRKKVADLGGLYDVGREQERAALLSLATRKADVDVLEKDRERHQASERKKAEAREEGAAAEVVRPTKA